MTKMNPPWVSELLAWYERAQRVLPWRETTAPYSVWISEIMLQQTRVVAAIPYFERFMRTFPTVQRLADADIDAVLKAWEGLGYYSRARNLHAAAQIIAHEMAGVFPNNANELRKLPGIGDYTAAAVASICYQEPIPCVDGNVVRVAARLFTYTGNATQPKAKRDIQAALLQPIASAPIPGDFNQAMMELGATICTPTLPSCLVCPLREDCKALAQGRVDELPVRPPRKRAPVRQQTVVLVQAGEHILMRQRPASGFLGGLWELPPQKVVSALYQEARVAGTVRHVYTHFQLELTVLQTELAAPINTSGLHWIDAEGRTKLACDRATQKALALLGQLQPKSPG